MNGRQQTIASLFALGAASAVMLVTVGRAAAQFYPQSPPAGQVAGASAPAAAAPRSGLSDHQRQMLEDAELCDVSFVDLQRGWAVGDRGAIWSTADGGRTWQLQTSGVDCRLHSVQFLDAQNGWAVGGYVHPYTHRTTGVVLQTRDGGARWTASPDANLPLVRRVKFVSQAHGWLIGEPSAIYPSGVFFSRDGGRSWQPVVGHSPGRWLCGDFRSDQGGAIAGRDGAMYVATPKGLVASKAPTIGLRAVRDVRFDPRQGGVLVGDGGVVMMTADAGQSWQPPRSPLPAAARGQFDWRGAAVVGQRIWAVGSPGTQILHSPDGGQTWQLQATGQSLPLLAIRFQDAQHGWAVGAMGTILATRDGGRTWLRQRSGATRAAMLIVLTDAEELPLELVARLGSEDGYIVVAEALGRRDVDRPLDYAASAADRAKQAMSAVGGSGLYQAWQFPLRERQLPLATERIVAAWDHEHAGRSREVLEEQLVRRIRQWQPEVVVVPRAALAEDELLQQATLSAIDLAARSDSYAEQIASAKLPPWKVKKIFVPVAEGEADDVTLAGSRLALRSGRSLSDLASRWQGLLCEEPALRPSTFGFRLAAHDVAAELARRDFFSGCDLNAGGEARRRTSDVLASSADFVREQAQRQRHVERLLAAASAGAVSDDAWLAQIDELTRTLERDGAARAINQLAQRYQQTGRVELADEARQMLVERYGDTPEGEIAGRQLFLSYTSMEQAWRQKASAFSEVQPAANIGTLNGENTVDDIATDDRPSQVVTTSGVSTAEKLTTHRSERAIALYKSWERSRPALAMEPAMQLALAAALRTTGETRGAEAIYRRLAADDESQVATGSARAELWLAEERGTCPKPLVRLKLATERPFLDGQLDDPVWQAAQPLALASRYGDDRAWPAVAMLACDGEFLFLAATCRRAATGNDRGNREEAGEDSLTHYDRIELSIDVNRDWNTAFTLAIDERGATADRCAGDFSWNAKWFVAHRHDDASWTCEAAVPLAALGIEAKKRDAWAIGLTRIAPGSGVQSWGQPASAAGHTGAWGLLILD